MKKLFAVFFMLAQFSNANAVYITDGTVITDDVRGIEWLQLRSTINMTYADALSTYSSDGWRYATNDEVVSMFSDFFSGFVSNNDIGTSSYSYSSSSYSYSCGFGRTCYGSNTNITPDSAYSWAQQDTDILSWMSVFYRTDTYYSFDSSRSLGMYRDEDGVLRQLGVSQNRSSSYSYSYRSSHVYGPEYTYEPADDLKGGFGSFLVRTNAVPEPSSYMLLLLGLCGLGFIRRNVSRS